MEPSDSSLNSSITAKFVPLQTVITPDFRLSPQKIDTLIKCYEIYWQSERTSWFFAKLFLKGNKNVLEVIIIVLHQYRCAFPYRVCTKTHQKGVKRHLLIRFYDFRHQFYAFSPPNFQSREKKTGDEDPLIFRGGRQVVTQCDIAVAPITFLFFFLSELRFTARDTMIRSLPLFFLLVYGQQRTTEWTEWEECDYQSGDWHKSARY